MIRRKIYAVTGTRADFGLLRWIMQGINESKELELLIAATAMHLSPTFGNTYQQIEEAGFTIAEKIVNLLNDDSPSATADSIATGISKFTRSMLVLKPDMILLLGDRTEMLAAAIAATLCRTPIVHIHGGETTEGLIDEAVRHSITKMSHIHFATTESHARRIVQMGENPDRVYNVGAPGLETLNKLTLLDKVSVEKLLGISFRKPSFMVTYHPVTLEKRSEAEAFEKLLNALRAFPGAQVIITYPNSDTFGRQIINLLHAFSDENPAQVYVSQSLGQHLYLSCVSHCDLVIGNSSSALIEVPALRVPTVNVGRRQLGRTAPESVLHCGEETDEIVAMINLALSPDFKQKAKTVDTLYGDGIVAEKVVRILESASLHDIIFKKFYELPA